MDRFSLQRQTNALTRTPLPVEFLAFQMHVEPWQVSFAYMENLWNLSHKQLRCKNGDTAQRQNSERLFTELHLLGGVFAARTEKGTGFK